MSDAAEFHPIQPRTNPELGLVLGANEITEHGDGEPHYPTHEFPLTAEQMVRRVQKGPSGIFGPVEAEVTRQERTHAVLAALAETCGEGFNEFNGLQTREKRLQRAANYLGQTVTVAEGTHRRRDVVDRDAALEEVRTKIASVNHPVVQILDQITKKFKSQLTDEQLAKLDYDILTITQWPKLHALYERQVQIQRSQGKR